MRFVLWLTFKKGIRVRVKLPGRSLTNVNGKHNCVSGPVAKRNGALVE